MLLNFMLFTHLVQNQPPPLIDAGPWLQGDQLILYMYFTSMTLHGAMGKIVVLAGNYNCGLYVYIALHAGQCSPVNYMYCCFK